MNKQDQLATIVECCTADLVLGTETWLNADVSNGELALSADFNIFRKDRSYQRGGGVMIAVKSHFKAQLLDTDAHLEILWIVLQLSAGETCIVGVCYRPPDASIEFVDNLNDSLSFVQCKHPTSPIILAGDFNYPGIDWRTCTPTGGTRRNECIDFLDTLSLFNMTQMVSVPTRGSSVLDLVLTTEPENMRVHVLDCISDHNVLHCEAMIKVVKPEKQMKVLYDYKRADVLNILSDLSSFSDHFLTSLHSRDTNENWRIVHEKLMQLKNQYIPTITITSSTHNSWFTSHVKRCINKKKRLYSKARFSGTDAAWEEYRNYAKICDREIKTAKDKFFNEDLPALLTNNTKKFWKVVNPRKCSGQPIHLTKDDKLLSPSEAAEELNLFFGSVYTEEEPISADLKFDSINATMNDIVITPEGIESAIERLANNSSPGPDGICPKLLKITKPVISRIFVALFQQSIDTGCVPDTWKIARVTPIFKSGDSSMPSNYRPISLTSIPCKLLEHIISSAVMTYLTEQNYFIPNQHGFQRGRSCETQLFELVTDLHYAVHASTIIDAVFIDLAKAFDKVPHSRLLMKLDCLKINRNVTTWINNFLCNRYQFVTVNDCSSTLIQVKSGVPQGSVLGPILFLIYINDISKNLASTTRLFADDCVIYRKITNPNDHTALQKDLDSIATWCDQWQMRINASKTKVITFTNTTQPPINSYLINAMPIEHVSSIKYLGVHLSADLSWNAHIDAITSKASKTLGFIRRHLHQANWKTKLTAYTSLVRSKIEYASFIWNPHQIYLINKLESMQNKAARFITRNYLRHSSITNIKASLSLPLLEKRRVLALLSHFHKLYHNHSSFATTYILPAHHYFPRLDHPFKVLVPYARTNIFYNSPLLCALRLWNDLPHDVVSVRNFDAFVEMLKSSPNIV